MSALNTARHRTVLRKAAIGAFALVVAVLPTACGTAFADGTVDQSSTKAVEGATDTDDEDGGEENSGAENDGAENGGEDNADDAEQGGEDEAAGQDDAAQDDAAKDDEAAGKDDAGKKDAAGLDVLGTDCEKSELQPHDGFEKGPRCVDTAFGEVGSADKNPSLVIADAPDKVAAGQDFTLKVSTRNLVRDRFLGAAAGGYYKEASFLDDSGIQRGHFHTACRILESADTAPDPEPAPEFFLATQDGGGGEGPDTVDVPVTGIDEKGTLQCAVWAGDGSHRIPMMQRADEIPAVDIVRITVE